MQKIPTNKELRDFGILIGIFFPLFIGWLIPLCYGHSFKTWTILISLPSVLIGTLSPKTLFYPYKGWMKLGNFLGLINSHIILGLVFIFVLIPISLIMNLFNYDPLRKRKNKKLNESYREPKKNHMINLNKIF